MYAHIQDPFCISGRLCWPSSCGSNGLNAHGVSGRQYYVPAHVRVPSSVGFDRGPCSFLFLALARHPPLSPRSTAVLVSSINHLVKPLPLTIASVDRRFAQHELAKVGAGKAGFREPDRCGGG